MEVNANTILFVCGGYRSLYGGNFVSSLVNLEKKLDLQYRCVYLFQKGIENREWIMDLTAKGHLIEYMDFDRAILQRIRDMKQLVDKYNVVLIHAHFGDKTGPSILGWIRPRVKVVLHEHSDWSLGQTENLRQKALLFVCKKIIRNIISHKATRVAVSEKIAENAKATYVPNGIALERTYTLDGRERSTIRNRLGISDTSILLLVFAWSPAVKGVDIAAQAVKNLHDEEQHGIELAIICGRNEEITKKYIQSHTNCTGEESYFHYLPPIQDVFLYHNIADVMLSSSRSEGFSYTLGEALSIAKPCISSDIDGVKWAKQYSSIEFFANGSVDGCKNAIVAVLTRLGNIEYHGFCEEDSIAFRREYNADEWARKILDVYGLMNRG